MAQWGVGWGNQVAECPGAQRAGFRLACLRSVPMLHRLDNI